MCLEVSYSGNHSKLLCRICNTLMICTITAGVAVLLLGMLKITRKENTVIDVTVLTFINSCKDGLINL